MWHRFGQPDFVLAPAHARDFAAAAADLSEMIGTEQYEDECWGMGIAAFDRLTQGQKQVVLLDASRAFLDERAESPTVTAPLAAAVAAIYYHLSAMIDIEIDEGPSGPSVRQLVLDALAENGYWEAVNTGLPAGEEPTSPLTPDSADREEWRELVESLLMDILEDFDFEMEEDFVDKDPEAAEQLKPAMNIHPDYFTYIPDDPPRKRVRQLKRRLLRLLESRE